MARALGLMYLTAPTVGVAVLLLPHAPDMNEAAVLAVIAVAYAFVPLLMRFPRVPAPAFGVMIAFSNVLVTLVVIFGGESSGPYAFFYVWATPLAFAFFSLGHALAQAAVAGALYGLGLATVSTSSGGEAGRWLLTMSTLLVAGLLVRAITGALREESERLERERRLHAVEINDNIVQGLVLAKAFGERGLLEQSQKAVSDTLASAQQIIGDLVGDEALDQGSLRRSIAAEPLRAVPREPPAADD